MFYHSFPRPKKGHDEMQKGLRILESILKNGILLVPEKITYQKEKENPAEQPEKYFITQSRFCITAIDLSELKKHERYFGNFHIEFKPDDAYAMGAVPVFYLPRTETDIHEWPLKKLSAGYVFRTFELQTLCQNIQYLGKKASEKKDCESINIDGKNRADGKTKKYSINAKQLRDTLDMLTINIISNNSSTGEYMDDALGSLKGISSLFYPTDCEYPADLHYFHQREWRITSGIGVDGERLDREPDDMQKNFLLSIDKNFYEKKMIFADGIERRMVEGCSFMPDTIYKTVTSSEPGTIKNSVIKKPIRDLFERIIVPKEALEKAKVVAAENGFEQSRIVDFETAVITAANELEYESAKIKSRIQMLKAACIG